MNTAEKISRLFDDDGTIWETKDGQTMRYVCENEKAVLEHHEYQWRYSFQDGSALTGNPECWDIEGSEPFSMVGA